MIFINMNIDKIFNLFNFGDGEFDYSDEELKQKEDFEKFKETPLFKLVMFKKIIPNHKIYQNHIIDMFKKVKPSLEIDEVEETGENIVYGRGWEYISQFEFKDELWESSSEISDSIELRIALKLSLNYFQEIEEYEKCAHLKKIIDLFEKKFGLIEKTTYIPIKGNEKK